MSLLRRLAIAALVLSAALLLRQMDDISAVRGAAVGPAVSPGAAAASSAEASAALRPSAVAVRYGGRVSAAALDGEAAQQAFRRFSALLGEALGSAGTPTEVTEAEFRGALGRDSVFFNPGAVFPLELLGGWLGVGAGEAGAHSADVLFLSVEDGAVYLNFREPGAGFCRCPTAALAEPLAARMAEFRAPSAAFAYENALLEGVEPYALIPAALPEIPVLTAASALDAADIPALTEAVGMNSRVAASYYDADGALVLTEDERTLRLGGDGSLLYRDPAAPDGAAAQDLTAAASLAYRLAEAAAGRSCGDAALVFSGIERGADGVCTVFFDYSAGGIPILLPEGHAAAVTVANGAVRWAQLRLRHYTSTEETDALLPPLQAAAAYAAQGGGTPALAYLDFGGAVRCDWVVS